MYILNQSAKKEEKNPAENLQIFNSNFLLILKEFKSLAETKGFS